MTPQNRTSKGKTRTLEGGGLKMTKKNRTSFMYVPGGRSKYLIVYFYFYFCLCFFRVNSKNWWAQNARIRKFKIELDFQVMYENKFSDFLPSLLQTELLEQISRLFFTKRKIAEGQIPNEIYPRRRLQTIMQQTERESCGQDKVIYPKYYIHITLE